MLRIINCEMGFDDNQLATELGEDPTVADLAELVRTTR